MNNENENGKKTMKSIDKTEKIWYDMFIKEKNKGGCLLCGN